MAEKAIFELEVKTDKFKSELEAGVLNPLESVSVEAKKVAKQISDDFNKSASNVGKAFAGQQVGAALQSIGKDVDALTKKLAQLEKEEKGIMSAMKGLGTGATRQLQSELDKVQKEAADIRGELTKIGSGTTKPAEQAAKKLATEYKSAKQELRALVEVISSGKLAGPELQAAITRAAELRDNIGDTNQLVNSLASDTRGIDALVTGAQAISAAFAVTSGVIGAFADNEEEAAEATRKVQSAISILLGVQELARIITDKNALSIKGLSVAQQINTVSTRLATQATTALGVSANTASIGFKALRAAIVTTGIGAVVALLGFLVSKLSEADQEAIDLSQSLKDVGERGKKAMEDLINAQLDLQLAQEKINKFQRESLSIDQEVAKVREQETKARSKQLQDILRNYDLTLEQFLRLKEGIEKGINFSASTIKTIKAAQAEIDKFFSASVQAELNAVKKGETEKQIARLEFNKEQIEAAKERNKQLLELEKQLQNAQLAAERARLQFIVAASKDESAIQLEAKQQLIAFELKAALAGLDIEQKERLAKLKELGITEGKQVEAVQKEIANRRKLIQQESYNEANQLQNQFRQKQLEDEKAFQDKMAEIEKDRIEMLGAATSAAQQAIYERIYSEQLNAAGVNQDKIFQLEKSRIQQSAQFNIDALTNELQQLDQIRERNNGILTETEEARYTELANLRIKIKKDELTELERLEREYYNQVRDFAVSTTLSVADSIFSIENGFRERHIQAIEDQRDQDLKNDQLTAEQKKRIEEISAAEIQKIRKKQAVADKAQALFNAVINTAQGVTAALGQGIAGIPLAPIIAALGAVQIAAIASQPLPKFKEGGLVGGKPHEQGGTLIEAEKNEFVIARRRRERHPELTSALNESDSKLQKVLYDKYIRPDMLAPRMDKAKRLKSESPGMPFKFSTRNVESELQGLKKQGKRDTDRLIGVIQRNKEQIRNNW